MSIAPIVSVLLSTYITLGLIFLPKFVHIRRTPKGGEKNDGKPLYHPDVGGIEQKRCQQLVHENADLKCQIEHVGFILELMTFWK